MINLFNFCHIYLVYFTNYIFGEINIYTPFISDPNFNVLFYKYDKSRGKFPSESFRFGDEFHHCNAFSYGADDHSQLPFQIGTGFVDSSRNSFMLTKCLDSFYKWIYETSFSNCMVFTTSVIIGQIGNLQDEEIIVVSCKTPDKDVVKEIFIEEYPKLQVLQIYTDRERNMSKDLPITYLCHGMKIPCLTNDPRKTMFEWTKTMDNPLPDFSRGQSLIIDLENKDDLITSKYPLNKYSCSLIYYFNLRKIRIKLEYSFYVEIPYKTDIKDQVGTIGRREFDVGEVIQCVSNDILSMKGNKSFHCYNPEILVMLTDISAKDKPLQNPAKFLKIEPNNKIFPRDSVYLKCILKGNAKNTFVVYETDIVLLTTNVTDYEIFVTYDGIKRFNCKNNLLQIFLFESDYCNLPLSKVLNTAKIIEIINNRTILVDFPTSIVKWYLLVCLDIANNILTPIVLDKGIKNILTITNLYPDYSELTFHQMKGFIFRCFTTNPNITVEWYCSNCLTYQLQRVIITGYRNSQLLEIISDSDMEIVYVCKGILPNNRFIEKNLSLSIQGPLIKHLVKPTFFYTLNDPVMCAASKLERGNDLFIPLPTRIKYKNYSHQFEISTLPGTNPFKRSKWTPTIPSNINYQSSVWSFSVCCLKYVYGYLQCGPEKEIEVIVNYTFKYNYDIPAETIYPGNIMKCCILSRNSLEPNKASMDGDSLYNCFPAQILLYVNKDRSATPANPGVLVNEGTQIEIPDTFEGIDIMKTATFVKCYSDEYGRKTIDMTISATQLNIRSCSLSPPPLLMSPPNQTLFLVDEIISCTSQLRECISGLKYDFKVEIGGQLITIIKKKSYITLKKIYLGKYIRITCSAGVNNIVSIYRDISVESLPYNLVINGSKKIMTNNQVITCSSEGFPVPTVVWTEVEKQSHLMIDDSTIVIRNWDKNGKYTYTCTAFNKHGEISETITFHLFNINMKDSVVSVKFYLILYLELIIYHVILVVILCFIFKEFIFVIQPPSVYVKDQQ